MKKIPILVAILFFSPITLFAASAVSSCSFTHNLTIGSSDSTVTCLQQGLIASGHTLSAGATGYFGPQTQAAVAAWQAANSISPATGYFGAISRAVWNSEGNTSDSAESSATSSNVPGCPAGAQFSFTTGQSCTTASAVPGCTTGDIFSATTGQPCNVATTQSQTAQVPQTQQTNYSAPNLASKLASQLAYITCDYYNRYGAVLFSQTSNGLLGKYTGSENYYVNTVLGAVQNTSYAGYAILPGSCNVQFPSGASLFAGGFSNITVNDEGTSQSPVNVPNNNIDFSQVVLPPNNYVATYAQTENYCSSRPSVGDAVAVFGWPTNASFETLTGTVTGTSGYEDITNISVPAGMEGSTAVSTTNGCILGQINDIGEIADQSDLSYLFGD